jgi:gamma-glutamylcyclotransferase (GGCT)/AIG2-like uncharacterized protein YtfP
MRFFFYGTLMAGSGNLVSESVHTRLRALGPATAQGHLFAIPTPEGWYPAFLAEPGGGAVHGAAYAALPEWTAEDLAFLDSYEAYHPDRPEASEYVRQPVEILCDGGSGPADAYVYCLPMPADAVPLPHGDFRKFLAETGAAPYGVSAGEISGLLSRLRQP